MNPINSTLLIIFGIIGYMIVVDENVAKFIVLQFKSAYVNTQRLYYMAKLHPKNPITTWQMNRKYDKIAKEMIKEYELKNNIEEIKPYE